MCLTTRRLLVSLTGNTVTICVDLIFFPLGQQEVTETGDATVMHVRRPRAQLKGDTGVVGVSAHLVAW